MIQSVLITVYELPFNTGRQESWYDILSLDQNSGIIFEVFFYLLLFQSGVAGGGYGVDDGDGEAEEESSSSSSLVSPTGGHDNDELEEFRQQWKKEVSQNFVDKGQEGQASSSGGKIKALKESGFIFGHLPHNPRFHVFSEKLSFSELGLSFRTFETN